MTVTVSCGQCGQRFAAAPHLHGQQVRCPNCQGAIVIPSSQHPSESLGPAPSYGQDPGYGQTAGTGFGGQMPPQRISSSSGNETRFAIICSAIGGGVLLLLMLGILVMNLVSGGGDTVADAPSASVTDGDTAADAPSASVTTAPEAPSTSVARNTIQTPPESPASKIERVQGDIQRMITALYKGDVDTVTSYTHPSLIQLAGGQASFKAQLEPVIVNIRKDRVELEPISFPAPPTFITTDKHEFAIIPKETILRFNRTTRIGNKSFDMGVRELGSSKWYYLSGRKDFRVMFPDFPSDVRFPEETEPRVLSQ